MTNIETDIEKAFAILGVSPTNDAATIRKAWRALVRSYHPDTARTDPVAANKRLTEINVAFDAVSACSAEDLARLSAKIAKREQTAARLRAEKLRSQRQEQQRRAQEAARKADAEAARRASHASQSVKFDEKPRKTEQTRRAETRSRAVTLKSAAPRSERAQYGTGNSVQLQPLVARAEQGFVEAMKACAWPALLPTRSAYA